MTQSTHSPQTFHAAIEDAGGGGAYITIPFDVEKVYGKKRVPVHAVMDGESYRGTLVRMGSDCHLLPVLKAIREKIGKGIGDEIEVVLQEDTQPRAVEIPADLKLELNNYPDAAQIFDALAYTHQKEYVQWIESAKQDKTRQSRITQTVEMVMQGKKVR